MKTLKMKIFCPFYLLLIGISSMLLSSCQDDNNDNKIWEPVSIGAVYINGGMVSLDANDGKLYPDRNSYLTNYDSVTINMKWGTDVTKLKMRLTPINGELIDFPTDVATDYTLPRTIRVKSFNGMEHAIYMRVISRPLLTDFFIDGIILPQEDIHFNEKSIIVQVPKGTDLTQLKVTMGFLNGKVSGFENGKVMDYTNPHSLTITGIDGTIYPYTLTITDKPVGPASIMSVTANGVTSDDVTIDDKGNVQINYSTLLDFSNANFTIIPGFGNQILNYTNGSTINLYDGLKVSIRGMDDVVKDFTILPAKVKPTLMFSKVPADFGFGADGGASLCFSGNYIVIPSHNGTAQGINYYSLNGDKVGNLTLPSGVDWGAVMGIRKVASDDKGVILGINLAATSNKEENLQISYNIYKWNSPTDANPVVYCSYKPSDLGLTNTRNCGINIQGSLDGNAVITVPMSASKIVLKWTIQGGNLVSPIPEKVTVDIPYNFGNYSAIEQYPGKSNTLVGAVIGSGFNGLRVFTNGATSLTVNTPQTTDLRVKTIGERTYLAHCTFGSGIHTLCLRDVTDNNNGYSYNMLWSGATIPTAANGNATNDADISFINGKWYAAYIGTNGGVTCYQIK